MRFQLALRRLRRSDEGHDFRKFFFFFGSHCVLFAWHTNAHEGLLGALAPSHLVQRCTLYNPNNAGSGQHGLTWEHLGQVMYGMRLMFDRQELTMLN